MTPASTEASPTSHREVELKYRVHALFEMPDLHPTASRIEHHHAFSMRATYHDTADLALFRWGITLRRREGGADEGWHMKLPVDGAASGTRDEVRLPLDSGGVGAVPGQFVEVIAPLLRERPLVPIVTLSTERTPTLLLAADGRRLVEVVDDVVSVERDGRNVSVFRELEVEAVDAEDQEALAVMDAVGALLKSAGAQPSSLSKAASALGPRTSAPPDIPDLPMPRHDGLAVDAIRAVLCRHVRHLLLADVAVRRDLPDSVHQMRVAARRLRSALATFEPLLDVEQAEYLRDELKWLANELGAIRDTEVMIERLDEHAQELTDEQDARRAREAIDEFLKRRLDGARSGALAALRSDRHQLLVDDLMSAAMDPPVTDDAFVACDEALLPLVAKTWRRLAKAISELEIDGPSPVWHRARIKAKRARYAAESVSDIFGKRMTRLAENLEVVTDVLGDHQDAHVAQGIIRELAGHPQTDGLTGMSLGLLHEYESTQEMLDRLRFVEIWPDVKKQARKTTGKR